MAGCTDYRVQCGWLNHPKRKKLERRLGRSAVLAVMDLWGFCAQSKTDGSLLGMSDEDIGIASGYDGDIAEFVLYLAEVRLLDGPEGERSIHDLCANNPWVAGATHRSQMAKKAACSRWQKTQDKMHTASNRNAPSPSPSPSPRHRRAGECGS